MVKPSRRAWGAVLISLLVTVVARAAVTGETPLLEPAATLVAPSPDATDWMGSSVAASGDTVIVGAWNAGPGDGNGAGAAYVFVRDGDRWSEQAVLPNPDPELTDRFGWSVAIDGDTALVGCPYDDGLDTDTGAAYVYARTGTTWSLQQKLFALAPQFGDRFGGDVAISGDTALVSARWSGVVGGGEAGSAHVYVRTGTEWTHQAQLLASDAAAGDGFGTAVAISGDTVVASAPWEDPVSVDEGSVYVFVRSGSSWTEQAKLVAGDPGPLDHFGGDVDLDGDTLVAGSPLENVLGVEFAGAAYVFTRSGTTWSQQAKLLGPVLESQDKFGLAVSLSSDAILVGLPYDWAGAMYAAGSSFLFKRTGTSWDLLARLAPAQQRPQDLLGWSVEVSGGFAFAGAPGFDADLLPVAGATFAFDIGELIDPWTDLGSGLAGAAGVPALSGSGSLVAGSPGALALSGAQLSAPAVLFVSFASTPAPFKGGTLVPVPIALSLPLQTNASGALTLAWAAWPGGLPPGGSLYFQYGIQDAGAPFGVALSNALEALLP